MADGPVIVGSPDSPLIAEHRAVRVVTPVLDACAVPAGWAGPETVFVSACADAIVRAVLDTESEAIIVDTPVLGDLAVPTLVGLRETVGWDRAIQVRLPSDPPDPVLVGMVAAERSPSGLAVLEAPIGPSSAAGGVMQRPAGTQLDEVRLERDRALAERDGLVGRVNELESALRGAQGLGAIVRIAARTSSPRTARVLGGLYRRGRSAMRRLGRAG